MHPISGFPKWLLEEERKVLSKTRHSSGLSRTRSPTRAHHRGAWILPDHLDKSFDLISRYQDPDYVFPGDADWQAISQIRQKFAPVSGASSDEAFVPNQTLQAVELEASERRTDAPGLATTWLEREYLTPRPPKG